VKNFSRRGLSVEWSAENFIKGAPQGTPRYHPGNRRCYFWTFTTPDETTPRELLARWNSFLTCLRRRYPGLEYLRVLEAHESGRRYHLHVLFTQFFRVGEIRELSGNCGFGRIHVVRVRDSGVSEYLAKYISKGRRSPDLKGVHLYSASLRNQTWYRVRVKDIEYSVDGRTGMDIYQGIPCRWSGYNALRAKWDSSVADEMAWRRTFHEWSDRCCEDGDFIGAYTWETYARCRLDEVAVEFLCDESGRIAQDGAACAV